MPQTLPEISSVPDLKHCSKSTSSLEIPHTNNSGASAPAVLPETANLSKSSSKLESKEQKPDHHPNDSVVEHGNMNGSSTSFQEREGSSQTKVTPSARLNDPSDIGHRRNSGRCRASTSSDVSDESSCSSMSSTKPHKANDSRWEAIQMVRTRDGMLGLSQFRLLKRLGCGDIGSVYLSELNGTKSYFAMKVMDKASLASRKKLLRAQTEKEILQCLDHPFLPTLYTHFETDKFSCLVMEYCPGGDLHTLRQRQPGKHFPEQAVNQGYCVQPACVEPSCIIQPSCAAPTTCFGPRFFSSKSKKDRKPKPEVATQINPWPELIAEPSDARSMSFVGTHEYLAPEIIKGEGHGSAVDWWTFGIFLYELLFGKTPFKGSGNRATLFNVIGQPLRFPEYPVVSFSARDLIRGLLVKEPQQRLAYKRGATEIKQHPFFEGVNWALIRCASPPEVPKPVEIERPSKQPPSPSGTTDGSGGAPQKGADGYLEFDFF
ncbi:hypothetical protein HU200_014104 [Digitaria exilis]|uniref:non-specific serine/threonine protein kinase n=1 Tax=Digitaria exilis TaxID=1010633 RepID=A0A835KLU1_9POAL|nr:hypothetical protein HU200_014104 [Digitaria exilis]